jgi:hypothetical protein
LSHADNDEIPFGFAQGKLSPAKNAGSEWQNEMSFELLHHPQMLKARPNSPDNQRSTL